MLGKLSNRPVSPHLTIYWPQVSSLFSIWHRLSAVTIFGYIIILVVILKLYLWIPLIKFHSFYKITFIIWNSKLTKFYLYLVLSYHVLNGIRHIKWNLGYTLQNYNLKMSSILFSSFLILFQLLNNF